ncbi:MAG: DoxX family membrane protein [Candidatus Chaera renei]|uniref:DoxX family membrane protein n=1 Tax=Candidatus Chaera renei TaxID=2506947 RepID=A0A4Q0AJT4_9BACT|nr:MAG: DoxX family membrane protein [Candidatus Chaera renei]
MAKNSRGADLRNSAVALGRLMLGFVFFWAFLDKLLGLGVNTPPAKAWLAGDSPTTGFLRGVEGPFAGFFHTLAGQAWVDWLFMLGLLGVGAALLLGVGVRLAAISGSALLLLMWAASLPLKHNPVVDDHLVYIALLAIIATAPKKYSLAGWWQALPAVRKNRWLW